MHKTLDVITIGEAMAMFCRRTEKSELERGGALYQTRGGRRAERHQPALARLGLNVGWVSRVGTTALAISFSTR